MASDPSASKASVELRRSFAQIYDLAYNDLWFYCLRRTSSAADAEDVLGETFAIAWEKFAELPSDRDARPWLFAIAGNILRNHNRKSARRDVVHLRLLDEAENRVLFDPIAPDTLALDDSAQIKEAFLSLRPADQEILSLAAWEELSSGEIGITLGCSELAARSRLHRARKKFERTLKNLQRTSPRQQVQIEEAAKDQRVQKQ